MIVWVKENANVTSYVFSQYLKITMQNHTITFLQNKDEVFIRVPRDLKATKQILRDGQESTIYQEQKEICKIVFLEREWEENYQKYAISQPFSIGSDPHNTIQIPFSYIPSFWITIDPQEKTIQTKQSCPYASFNDKEFPDNCTYAFLDSITIAHVRMIMMEDGITMNVPADVHIHLQEYSFHQSLQKLKTIPKCKRIYNKTPPFPKPFVFHEALPQATFIETSRKPFLLESGPTLLMALASLCVGLISSYLAYNNGKEMVTLIPMLVLPFVMLLSVIVFQPLIRVYENKQNKKRKKQMEEQCCKKHDACKQEYEKYQEMVAAYIDTYYPSMDALIERIIHGEAMYQHTVPRLVCGYHHGMLQHDVLEAYQQDIDVYASKKHSTFIDFTQYPCVSILHSEANENLLHYLILQIAAFFDIPMIIYAQSTWIQDRPWLRLVQNTFQDQQRYLTSDIDKVEEWMQFLGTSPFFLFDQIGYKKTHENAYHIALHPYLKKCDITIDIQKQTLYDHHTFQETTLCLPQAEQYDMHYALLCLKDRSLHAKKTDFFSIQQITDFHFEEKWKQNDINTSLRAIIGVDENVKQIVLDLHETKDGPHGLIAGMTGSGKSALLITMLFSLAMQYSYEDVQFAMIDFKGGGAAASLQQLPHMVAALSNLDTMHLSRALVSFQNECLRRQRLLAEMSEFSEDVIDDIQTYRNALKKFEKFPKIADLIIVVDEFAELKKQRPDFLEDLISIARIGRSLGIHLVLCTQRPTGIISEEIWANCSFKIALRVAETSDLQEVLHRKCKNTLQEAGDFYVLSRNGLKRGKSAYAGAKYRKLIDQIDIIESDGSIQNDHAAILPTQQQILIQAFQKCNFPRMQPLWLPPLSIHAKDIEDFAVVDDYYHRQQYAFSIFEKCNTMFLGRDIQEREICFLNLVDCILQKKYSLFVIDDLHLDVAALYQACPNWITYCDATNQEWIKNVFSFLQKDKTQDKVLIITDISRFQSCNEEMMPFFHDCLEHAELYKVHIIVFSGSMNGISYRDFSNMQNRLCLKNENVQEIQQFLETNEKIITTEHAKGLLKKEHVLSFALFSITYAELLQKAKQRFPCSKKRFSIPYMPAVIDRNTYKGSAIPIGISYKDYQWVTLSPTLSFYIVSEYKEEWGAFYRSMQKYAKCTVRGDSDENDGQLIFLSTQEYRQKHEDYPVMYIGSSFSRQYMFYAKEGIHDERDAIVFRNYESEKVRVI